MVPPDIALPELGGRGPGRVITIRIIDPNGAVVRDVEVEPGETIEVLPGQRVQIPDVSPDSVTVSVVGADVAVAVGGEDPIVLGDLARHLDTPDSESRLTLGRDDDVSIIESLDQIAQSQAAAEVPLFDMVTSAGSSQNLGEPIGQVETVNGLVVAQHVDGTRVSVAIGDPVFLGDVVQSGPEGAVGIVLLDETTFSMAANGRIVLDEMIYDPGSQSGAVSLSILQGIFTFVSGQVAKTDPGAMTLETPVATIGIRGTQAGVDYGDAESLTVVNMEESDGNVGELVITTEAGTGVINRAYQSTTISSPSDDPSQLITLNQDDVVDRFSGSLSVLPTTNGNANSYGLGDQSGLDGVADFQTAAGGNGASGGGGTGSDGSVDIGGVGGEGVSVDLLEGGVGGIDDPEGPGSEISQNLNRPPTAFDGSVSTLEDTAAGGTASAKDPDDDPLTFSDIGSTNAANLIFSGAGNFQFTPTANFSGQASVAFQVDDGRGGTDQGTISVIVAAVADAPAISAEAAEVIEDNLLGFRLSVSLVDTDGSEAITAIELSDVAPGTQLSWLGGPAEVVGGDGTFILTGSAGGQFTADDLARLADGSGLTLTPPPDDDADLNFTVNATSTEVNVVGAPIAVESATTVQPFNLVVDAEAGNPTVAVADAVIAEDASVTPQLAVSFTDRDDDGETQSVEMDIPAGWTVVAANGWLDDGGGVFSLDVTAKVDAVANGAAFDVDGPMLRPPLHDDDDLDDGDAGNLPDLTVRAISTQVPVDSEGQDLGPNVKIASDSGQIIVDAEAGAPAVAVADATIDEDGTLTPQITVDFDDALDDGETHVLEIDIPAGWTVVNDQGWVDLGSSTFGLDVSAQADAAGDGGAFNVDGPVLRPPLNDDSDLDNADGGNLGGLAVRAIATEVPDDLEGGDTAPNQNTDSDVARVIVDAVAGAAPAISVTDEEVVEDGTVTPTVTASFNDVADSDEVQSLQITVPVGWTITDPQGWTDLGGGILRLDVSAQAGAAGDGGDIVVSAPTMRPPQDVDTDVNDLAVVALSTQTPDDLEGSLANNETSTTSLSSIVVDAETGDPTVAISDAEIVEDNSLTPQITASFTDVDDPDETHALEIDIPAGWSVADANGWSDAGGGVFSKDVTVDAAAAGEATGFVVDGPILQPPLNGDTNLAALTVRAVSTEVPDDLEGADTAANEKTVRAPLKILLFRASSI